MNTWPGGKRHAMTQDAHERWNASHYPGTRQLCSACGEATGRCEEDALLNLDTGEPVCDECYGGGSMSANLPGPGDSETWPACDGHPHDPRTPESDDDPTMDVIAEARGFLRLAEIAFLKGNSEMAKNALTEAMLSLQELVGEKT